jgi:hypothetical protein
LGLVQCGVMDACGLVVLSHPAVDVNDPAAAG